MHRLKNHLRELHQRLNAKQKARKRLRDTERWMREHGFKFIAKTLDRRERKLEHQCKDIHEEIRKTEKRIEELQHRKGRGEFVQWARGEVGVQEGSARHMEYIQIVGGGSASWPWCSCFAAAGLIEGGGFSQSQMPSNPWYSGAWLTWSNGHRVSYSERQEGDLVIYDWGDGGMTDHVEIYVGANSGIGGNESNAVVGPRPVAVANVVGIVRPDW